MIRRRAIAIAIALGTAGCDSGAPASPLAGPAAEAAAGPPAYAVCPDMDASFGSIYGQMLNPQQNCGSANAKCHSPDSVGNTGITLDYALDASAVYAELLGDGGGFPSENLNHPDVYVPRVVPFDAGASMLYLKLTIDSGNDPQYGSGMPQTAPGSVCPDAVKAVADWINQGAPQN